MTARKVAARLAQGVTVLLVTSLVGVWLIRSAPGYGVDERDLDPRLRGETVEAARAARARDDSLPGYYGRFWVGLLQGDWGESVVLGQPVRELIAARAAVTAVDVTHGLAVAWALALPLAAAGPVLRRHRLARLAALAGDALLCVPLAVLAFALFLLDGPPAWALAAALFPKLYRQANAALAGAMAQPHVLAARARGVPRWRLLAWHVLPGVAAPLAALAGVSVSLALGASVPVEVFFGRPGVGQLAWQAVLGRDLPVLVTLTLLLAAVTWLANVAAEALVDEGTHSA